MRLLLSALPMIFLGLAGRHAHAEDLQWVAAARDVIARETARSARDMEGGLHRRFSLEDIDQDGTFELLARVSHYEAGLEFMNVELAPAFEWTTVYRFDGQTYREATDQYPGYLLNQRTHYVMWLSLLRNPAALSGDSRQLIRANRDDFVGVVEGLIERIDRMTKQPPPD